MNKSEFIEALAAKRNMTKTDAAGVLDAVTDIITEQLQAGNDVVLPGFVSFSIGARAARTGRNPRTGEALNIAASNVVKIKAGKSLKEAVQK